VSLAKDLEDMNFDAWEVKKQPLVTVAGVGDAGANAVQHVLNEHLLNVECIAINTHGNEVPALVTFPYLIIGPTVAHGLGSGGNPEVGQRAAEESRSDIERVLTSAPHVFIVSGMGGGTGTGAVPVIARIAEEIEARITVIVSQPFTFEGSRRIFAAEAGIRMLKQYEDPVIVSNDHWLYLSIAGRAAEHSAKPLFSLVPRMLAWQVLARLCFSETY
jgi:cell division protein FtsZ